MSDAIKHECGIAYIRLLKPFSYYQEKYGSSLFGIKRLRYLMEKQKNRGQDGAGIGVLKLDNVSHNNYIKRLRFSGKDALEKITKEINREWAELRGMFPNFENEDELLASRSDYVGEISIGHLRYSTQGLNDVAFCHPFTLLDIEPTKSISLAGNFNIVNTRELLQFLGRTPLDSLDQSDLSAMIQVIRHFFEAEMRSGIESPDIKTVLQKSCALFDGGYACVGVIGNGDSFVFRDRNGIRPLHYFKNDEFVIAASERVAIMTCFGLETEDICELPPGAALIVKSSGEVSLESIAKPAEKLTPCSFERIYFSKGNDPDIYRERIQLGQNLAPEVLSALNNDVENAMFSFIPNSGEIAFYGLVAAMENYLKNSVSSFIVQNKESLSKEEVSKLLSKRIRAEKLVFKDAKMRTFIEADSSRNDMVSHVYDITHGLTYSEHETLVLIDDSIVRGTTLKNSILKILDRLNPERIIIVSSSPQIRYPDCYGIDMSKFDDFIAFRAAIELLKERKLENVIEATYQQCKQAEQEDRLTQRNYVQAIYERFTDEEISSKIAQMLSVEINASLTIIFQTLEGLYEACPNNHGDWYFTGNYPTPGGTRVSNIAFINYFEGKNTRGY